MLSITLILKIITRIKAVRALLPELFHHHWKLLKEGKKSYCELTKESNFTLNLIDSKVNKYGTKPRKKITKISFSI